MPIFLDTTGNPTLGIGICARCGRKFPLHELHSDPNSPGLKVCEADLDEYDPYRLPPRAPDQISLPFVRPDTRLAVSQTEIVLTGAPADTGNQLDWTTLDLVEYDQYTIYRRDPGGSFEVLLVGNLGAIGSYLDTEVVEGLTYVYYVEATDLGGATVRSNQVSILTNLADYLLADDDPEEILAVSATDLFIWRN